MLWTVPVVPMGDGDKNKFCGFEVMFLAGFCRKNKMMVVLAEWMTPMKKH